jgi:transmembrane sensor
VGLVFATALAITTLSLKPLQADTYSTKIGEISSVRLDDGTEVRLNTDSTLRVRFAHGQRRVELVQGQAYFEVAHDPSRPFVVLAGGARVRAVGTQFDVRRSEGEVRVVLTEGRVAVTEKRSGETTLTPGQAILLDGKRTAPRPSSVDVTALTSWRTGTLTFHNQTLADAVQELNRYSKTKIVLDASAPRQLVINGAFQAGDTHEFVAAASLLYGLKAKTRSDGDIELSAAGAS